MFNETNFGRPHSKRKRQRWRTSQARLAFHAAFRQEFTLPNWVRNIRLLEGSQSDDRPSAIMYLADDAAAIKVLPSPQAVDAFWLQYPDADVVTVYLQKDWSPEHVRKVVFAAVHDCIT